jgi:hypothetical protein
VNRRRKFSKIAFALKIFKAYFLPQQGFQTLTPKNRKAELTSAVKRFYDFSPRAEDFAAGKRFGAKKNSGLSQSNFATAPC